MVGVLMFGELSQINFKDTAIAVSTFLIVIMMPLTFSITNGLAFGRFALIIDKEQNVPAGILFLTCQFNRIYRTGRTLICVTTVMKSLKKM